MSLASKMRGGGHYRRKREVVPGCQCWISGGIGDYGGGKRFQDRAPAGNHAMGNTGWARTFDGVADYVNTGYNIGTVARSSFTYAFRVRLTNGHPSRAEVIMGASDNTPEYSEVRCVLRPDGTLRTRWRQGETMVHCTTNEEVFGAGQTGWASVVAVHDFTAGQMEIWIDGVDTAVSDGDLSSVTPADLTVATDLYLGAMNLNGNRVLAMAGELGDVRIWNVALNDAQAAAYHSDLAGNTVAAANLPAWWKLDESSANPANGDPVVDYSDNGNHGTLPSAATVVTGQDAIQQLALMDRRKYTHATKSDIQVSGPLLTNLPAGYALDSTVLRSTARELNFPGAAQVILDGMVSSISADAEGTICFWWQLPAGAGANPPAFISFSDGDDADSYLAALHETTTDEFKFEVTEAAVTQLEFQSLRAFDDTEWHFGAIGMDAAGAQVVIDGAIAPGTFATGSEATQMWLSDVANLDSGQICAIKVSGQYQTSIAVKIGQIMYFNRRLAVHELIRIWHASRWRHPA